MQESTVGRLAGCPENVPLLKLLKRKWSSFPETQRWCESSENRAMWLYAVNENLMQSGFRSSNSPLSMGGHLVKRILEYLLCKGNEKRMERSWV